MKTKLLCKYCGKEIHEAIHALFVNTPLAAEMMPSPSENFPFHRSCFCMWVYKKLNMLSPEPLYPDRVESDVESEQRRICSAISLDQENASLLIEIAKTLNQPINYSSFEPQDSTGFKTEGSSQVMILALSRCPLITLPTKITAFRSLQELYAVGSRLEYLPETLGDLKNLQTLIIDDNNLKTLPDSIGSLEKLRFLSLKGNKLHSLPKSILKLKNLKNLRLSGNPGMEIDDEITTWINGLRQRKCKIDI